MKNEIEQQKFKNHQINNFDKQMTRLLRTKEGEVLSEYKDHLGYSTIGVGRLIDRRKGGVLHLKNQLIY